MGDEKKKEIPASEAISKIAEGFGETLKSLKDSFELVLTAQNELSGRIETSLTELTKLTVKLVENTETQKVNDEAFKKQVAETREFLTVIAKSHASLLENMGFVVNKSNVEIAQQVASTRAMEQNRMDAEKAKKADEDAQSYKGVAEQFV